MTDTVAIRALGQHGDGIAEVGGETVFVPYVLPGETVEIAREDDRGRLVAVRDPSPDRVEPVCRHFGACGGCQLQHMSLAAQKAFKRDLVEAALRRAGIETPVSETLVADGGRRRATFHARGGKAGFMRAHSHDLLDIESCPILVPQFENGTKIAKAMQKAVGDCDVKLGLANGLDVAVRATRRSRAPQAPVEIARRFRLIRLALNGEVVYQLSPPAYSIGRAEVLLPVEVFLQPTMGGEAALADLVPKAVAGRRHVADLFCGVGTFALRIAESARVYAADGDRPAIAALDLAVRLAQGLKPVTAVARDLFREPLTHHELKAFDAVVFDPPRAGAEAQARQLASSKVKVIVGVSCEPRTFARDAAILVAGGYRLEAVTPVDQFRHSAHVELVGVFRR